MTGPVVFDSVDSLRSFLWHPHAHENFDEYCPLLLLELGEEALLSYAGSGQTADGAQDSAQELAQELLHFPAVTALAVTAGEIAGPGEIADPGETAGPGEIADPSEIAGPSETGSTAAPRHDLAQLLSGFDILLANQDARQNTNQDASQLPASQLPWVVVPDLASAIAGLTATLKTSPQASISLAQLLRASQNLSVRDALMAESWVYSKLQSGAEFARWLQTSSAKPVLAPATQSLPVITQSAPVLVEEHGDNLRLILNRPERRNAFNAEMRDALVEALRATRLAPPSGGITLSGAGKAFCSGGDLDEFGTTPNPTTAHIIRSLRNTAWEIHLLSHHITAKLHGACVGAGIELPSFAHQVVATEDAFFWLPEVRLGLVPGAGGTAGIPRRIGRQRTCWMALSNRRFDTRTALAWGLIDDIESD